MPVIIEYLLKVSIALALVFLFYQLVLRRLTFYNWNRWYLVGYSVLSFLIPFMNITDFLFKHELDEAQFVRMVPVYNLNLTVTDGGFEWNSWNIAVVILIAGMMLMGIRMLLQFFSLRKMKAKAKLLNEGDIKLFHVEDNIMPFSFSNGIYINSKLHTEAELQEIIRHEFVHVKQKHSIDILFAEFLCMLLWFHPAAWFIRKAIRQNLEFIADEKVLQDGVDKKQYQYLLLKVVGNNHYSIASNFNFSSLKNRIIMMNQIKSARVQVIRFLFILPLVAVLLLAFREVKQKERRKDIQQQLLLSDTIPASEIATINVNKKDGESSVTIVLKNGTTDTYNLDDPKQKEAFEKKYGKLDPPPPPPALSNEQLNQIKIQKNVQTINISNEKGQNIVRIRLNNGKEEVYKIDNIKEKEQLELKYGKLVTTSPPPPPVPSVLSNKGYYLSVADDMGECIVIVKDKKKNIVEALKLTDWTANEKKYEAKYGKIPPPPPPAAPATITVTGYKTIKDVSTASEPAAVMVEGAPVTVSATSPVAVVEGKPLTTTVAAADPLKPVVVQGKPLIENVTTTAPGSSSSVKEVTVVGYRTSTDKTGNVRLKKGNDNVLYILDDKEATADDINALNPNTIESISVLKNENAVKLYGEKGKNGVIIIKTKKKVTTFQFFTNPLQPKEPGC